MTSNTNPHGFTDLDIMLMRAGAPTRFDSPYWTKREVDWAALAATTKAAMRKAADAIANLIPAPAKLA